MQFKKLIDRGVRYLLLTSALISAVVVFLIFFFTVREGLPAIPGIGLRQTLGTGYSAYAKIARPMRMASNDELHAEIASALTTARSKLQDEVESDLASLAKNDELTENEKAKRQTKIQDEYKCLQGFLEVIETALNSQVSGAELRAVIERAQQNAVEAALECKLGFNIPSWGRGVVMDGLGLYAFLTGSEWRPDYDKLGIKLMVGGLILVTLMAIAMGVPLALFCAIFLAEVAPNWIRHIVRFWISRD